MNPFIFSKGLQPLVTLNRRPIALWQGAKATLLKRLLWSGLV